ncbi:hypothetical protein [Cystobacter fuscus]|uniref:hypothetical protein n=1 Tax=Cystobacter fuscus TaxID=43 RepID=UPI002B2A3E60|nr:hypothetical protein F0U63_27885 [Cystobacter fuscus]
MRIPLLFPVIPLLMSVSTAAEAQIGDVSRAERARQIRVDAANAQRNQPLPEHPNNGDEQRYSTRFANYTKGLPHDALGNVSLPAYQQYLSALRTGNPLDFEAIPLGGERKLVNPQAAYAFTLEGADPQATAIQPAPRYASNETAGEMDELYWMALARDVNFDEYTTSPLIAAAAQRLNQLRLYRGAKANGVVTPEVIFRADVEGALKGPFLSQFLIKDIPYSAGPFVLFRDEPTGYQTLPQRNLVRPSGDDRVTQFAEWLDIQNGRVPTLNGGLIDERDEYEPLRRHIRNARDLTEYVHTDYPLESTLSAALLLARQGDFLANGNYDPDPKSSFRALDELSPYRQYLKQEAFVTFGNSDAQSAAVLVTNTALRADWFQKWLVHRRLRPEEFGGHVDNLLAGRQPYPINPELLNSPVLPLVFARNAQLNATRGLSGGGTYLLSQAFPEAAPLHPAYGSGHSTYIGAGVTMLKAFYSNFPLRNPEVVVDDGLALAPYEGGPLMMYDELDKLASNIGVARLFAGVHWRSDHDNVVRLGELYALRTLQDMSRLYNEQFPGFSVRTFGGNTLTITANSPNLPNVVTAVTALLLVNADTGQPVPGFAPLYNGATIDLSDLAAWGILHPAIEAVTYEPKVGSVRFVYDGAASDDDTAPYRLGTLSARAVGSHVLRATPYSESQGGGLGGVPLVIRFTVTN